MSRTPKPKATDAPLPASGDSNAPRRDSRRPSLADQAYYALREQVLNHRLPIGELLNEHWLCQKLGYGRTPMHQALQRLHQEELIQIVPRKGILVKLDSIARIIDLLDARSILEPVLASRAAVSATPADIEELTRITSRTRDEEGNHAGSVDRFIERDHAFHAKLAAIGGSPVLIELQKSLHERAMRFWHSNLWRTLDEGKAADEHAAVIAAIARGDADAAAVAMSGHIAEITARLRKLQSMSPGDMPDASGR
ncbi:MAG: GntR family transcriptional regulator [Sphingomonas bacterium]